MSVNIDEIDFSDPELYEHVQRSDRSTFANNSNSTDVKSKNINVNVKNNVVLNDDYDDYINNPSSTSENNKNDMFHFVKKILLICLCLFLIYLFVYRYIIGYTFMKNKQYVKSMAVMSPEIMTLSSFLL